MIPNKKCKTKRGMDKRQLLEDVAIVLEKYIDFFNEKALVCLFRTCKVFKKLIENVIKRKLTDISRGTESLAIPCQKQKKYTYFPFPHFSYVTKINIPSIMMSHKLPEEIRRTIQVQDQRIEQILQGLQFRVYIAKSTEISKGWGVFAAEDIKAHQYIGEYVGELISTQTMQTRYRNQYDRANLNYVLTLREKMSNLNNSDNSFSSVRTIIDATYVGNFTRLFNHSCHPTLELEAIRVDSYIPRLVFFTKRLIKKDEELTFHYGANNEELICPQTEENQAVQQKKCYCGSGLLCQGSLPFDPSL